jgi:oligopeptide transport system substrate-binding protein
MENIVTNGPFLLESWQPAERIVLRRNPGYLGHFTGNLERVELNMKHDWVADLKLYEDDKLDIMRGLPARELIWARQTHARDYFTFPATTTNYLCFDISRTPFDDPRVRRAFAHAIDKDTWANVILHGLSTPATGGFIPPGLPGYSPGIGLSYDPHYASQLLEQAGYPNGQGFPSVDLYLVKGDDKDFQFILDNWSEKFGLEINVKVIEWLDLYQSLRQSLPNMHVLGWSADYPDPDNFLRVFVSQYFKQGWNEGFEQLLERARGETDQAARLKLYQNAERVLIREAAIIPIIYNRWHIFVKPWIKNLQISPIGSLILKRMIIESH